MRSIFCFITRFIHRLVTGMIPPSSHPKDQRRDGRLNILLRFRDSRLEAGWAGGSDELSRVDGAKQL